jgi:CRP-like cAMP-binding protein
MASRKNGNRILAALSDEEHGLAERHTDLVQMKRRQSIWEPGETIEEVYFPLTAVTSVVAQDENGGQVEVGTIGNEGVAGLPAFLGADTSPQSAFVQVSGDAYRMSVGDFKRLSGAGTGLRRMLELYTQGFVNQVSQSVACNRLHDVRQRLARWLLMTRDRVPSDRFELTQEFVGQMLGVRRATVTEAAGGLQEAGLIRYSRGVIEILDRPGLEAASCTCYRIVQDEFDRLLGPPAS